MSITNFMSSTNLRPVTSPGTDKRKLSTSIHTDTTTVTENGWTETTVTKTITDKFTDGTTSTRKELHTTRDEEVNVNGSGGTGSTGGTGGSYLQRTGSSTGNLQSQNPVLVGHSPYQLPAYSGAPGSQKNNISTDDNFINQAQMAHNRYRSRHSAPPITISTELCQVAQNWANHLTQRGAMENSHFGYGENIYWSSANVGTYMRGEIPVDYWYNEISNYDWYKMDFQRTTGAFTQLIWKETNQFGIAKASGPRGTYVVAFYLPPGNVIGQFKQNITRSLI